MRVICLTNGGRTYTSNAHLVLGNWSAIGDVNTLIDTGRDASILDSIRRAPTGVGKRAVEQVILTHSHYDHVEILGLIRTAFGPRVCGFEGGMEGMDRYLKDGDELKAGDRVLEVIHAPGHSSDSICLYCAAEGVLFAGDAPLLVNSADSTYEEGFVAALERICTRDVRSIYFGHGAPLKEGCNAILRRSVELVTRSASRPESENATGR